MLYGINLTLAMALNLAHWKYATKNSRLVDPKLNPKIVKSISKHIIIAMIMYWVCHGHFTYLFVVK